MATQAPAPAPAPAPATTVRNSLAAIVFKQYPGQQQVDLGVVVDVPGSWFGEGAAGILSAAERREKYKAVAVEYDAAHVFQMVRGRHHGNSKAEAIRFLCPDDAAEDNNHEGYWMRLDAWNRYRNDTYRDRREDELQYILADDYERATAAVRGAGAQGTKTAELSKPPVYSFFNLISVGTHEMNTASGLKAVPCEFYECKKRGKGCKVRGAGEELIKVVKKATSGLLKHLRICEGEETWLRVRAKSKNSKVAVDETGAFLKKFTFKEMLEHHVRFVVYCFMNWKHFNAARCEEFVDYITGFDKRLGVPARETCVKIINIIRHLLKENLESLLAHQKKQLGSPFLGYLDDIWSKRRCRQSFACARVALGVDGELLDAFTRSTATEAHARNETYSGSIHRCSPLLAFKTLPSARHSGGVIAEWKKATLTEAGLTVKDIRRAVWLLIDGCAATLPLRPHTCSRVSPLAAYARRMGRVTTRRATTSYAFLRWCAIRTTCSAASSLPLVSPVALAAIPSCTSSRSAVMLWSTYSQGLG